MAEQNQLTPNDLILNRAAVQGQISQRPLDNAQIANMLASQRNALTPEGIRGDFIQNGFIADNVASFILRQREARNYLMIQNTANAGIIYVSFGQPADPLNSLTIGPGGFYEPFAVPQNEIYVFGSLASVLGVVIIGK